MESHNRLRRREFLRGAAISAATAGALASAATRDVLIVVDRSDPVASAAPVQWALSRLEGTLKAKGFAVRRAAALNDAQSSSATCLLVAGARSELGQAAQKTAAARVAAEPEALSLIAGAVGNRPLTAALGHDVRGAVWALLELADRVEFSDNPVQALSVTVPVIERPANKVRALSRLFTSDVEDKPWYNDREMWPRYLDLLATQRFNRFHLAFGIGYDFIRQVTDAYFLFPYPFLLSVPGYDVRVPQLPDSERDHNLEMLQYISEQTAARGMDFQLGLWMHGYEWINSPNPNCTIAGVTKANHGPYCRDAIRLVLQRLPAVTGVTLRVHGESGVEEGSYAFWKDVFDGVATCGRKIEIDMHAKGMDQTMIDLALATRQPVTISPKYWAEHLGMPYAQANIRQIEKPQPGKVTSGLMKLSAGSRSFLRYGYGDLLREDRQWGVIHRIWPGTQRLLIWADPVTAAAHARTFRFCGSDGVDIMEPLSFKGRRGSGIAGDRCAYADTTLRPRWDWEKYAYSHLIWGRLLYNPEAGPETWQRYLRSQFGSGAADIEAALANSGRILPIVTTAHASSAGNNSYWPEIYLNQSMVDPQHPGPYTDSPAPKVFGNVSPLDPQLFARINDYADSLLEGNRNGKYSPIEVAEWIEDYASAALDALSRANKTAKNRDSAEYRRMTIDAGLQARLGRFFGAKFRAGVLYRIYEKTASGAALEASIRQYESARNVWADLAGRAKPVYQADITVGEHPQLRGHWMDRIPAIDADLHALAAKLGETKSATPDARVAAAIADALGRPKRIAVGCRHAPPPNFTAGQPLSIQLSTAARCNSVRLYYRHVDQAEDYEAVEMTLTGDGYRASIPAAYTSTHFPLEYMFELSATRAECPVLFPGFNAELTNQPYFVIRRA